MSPYWLRSPLGGHFEASTSYCNNYKAGITSIGSGLEQSEIKSQFYLTVTGSADRGLHAGTHTDLFLFLVRPWAGCALRTAWVPQPQSTDDKAIV